MAILSQRTIAFLVTETKVLFGYKKTGFGSNKYLGIGGKIEAGESEIQAAAREIKEEIGVTNPVLKKVGDFSFLFPEKPHWSQQVHVFLCQNWEGDPVESEEIRPEWFDKQKLPLTHMWDDAQFWLPAVLNGHSLKGTFTFSEELKVLEYGMKEEEFRDDYDKK
jgi:8-oxo-dGTP diphosphatase